MGNKLWCIVSKKHSIYPFDNSKEIRLEYFTNTKQEAKQLLKTLKREEIDLRKMKGKGLLNNDYINTEYEIHKAFGVDKGVLFLITGIEEGDIYFDFDIVDTIGDLQCDTIYYGDKIHTSGYYYAYIYGFDSEQVSRKFKDLLLEYNGIKLQEIRL